MLIVFRFKDRDLQYMIILSRMCVSNERLKHHLNSIHGNWFYICKYFRIHADAQITLGLRWSVKRIVWYLKISILIFRTGTTSRTPVISFVNIGGSILTRPLSTNTCLVPISLKVNKTKNAGSVYCNYYVGSDSDRYRPFNSFT